MPYLQITTNIPVSDHTADVIQQQMGYAISSLKGKSEQWLAMRIEDDARMWFAGNDDPFIMTQVAIYGSADLEDYEMLTARITDILESTLDVSPERIYVKYSETDSWGWNGRNF